MPSQNQIASQIIQGMAISIPDLDTAIGAPMRNVIDVVSQVVAEQTADQYLLSYGYDINSMSGANLDNFVANFGFARYPAKRAVGYVIFARSSAAPKNIPIAIGTQVSTTQIVTPILFTTIIPAIMPQGTTSVTVPVQAVLGGSNGNVGANTIVNEVSPLPGISNITNVNACIYGTNAESDDQLRNRFLKTVFRSLTGTEATYLGIALEDPNVSQVKVIGADETFNEQIQIQNGIGVSSVQGLAYLYPNSSFFGTDLQGINFFSPRSQYNLMLPVTNSMGAPTVASISTTAGALGAVAQTYKIAYKSATGVSQLSPSGTFTPSSGSANEVSVTWVAPAGVTVTSYQVYKLVGSSYYFLASTSGLSITDIGWIIPSSATGLPPIAGIPLVETLDATNIPDGIYQLQYRYLSSSSRNSPANNITNRIDIYVNGLRPIEAVQDLTISAATLQTFTNTPPADPILNGPTSMYRGQFTRVNGGGLPTSGNYFTALAYSPIIDTASGLQGGAILPNPTGTITWTEGTNFWIVNDISQFGQGPASRAGIEWLASNMTTALANSISAISVDFIFNQVPTSIQSKLSGWRILTTDPVVHQAQIWYLDMYLGVILNTGYSVQGVQTQIENAINNYVDSIAFDGVVQVSSILSVAQQIPGVVAVRFLTSQDDSTYYAIQQVQALANIDSWTASYTVPYALSRPNISLGTLVVMGTGLYSTVVYQEGVDYSINELVTMTTDIIAIPGGIITNGQVLTVSYDYSSVLNTYTTTSGTPLRAIDIQLPDNILATVNNVTLIQFAQNMWGAV